MREPESSSDKRTVKESIKHFAEKKGIGKWFQRDNLIILVLSGILLLIIALPTKEGGGGSSAGNSAGTGSRTETGKQAGTGASSNQSSADPAGQTSQKAGVSGEAAEDYAAELERRLAETLQGMAGVGKVKVMITMESSGELVVEKDEPMNRSNTTESDSEGGSRSVYQTDNKEQTVYRTTGGDSEPYVVKTLTPRVEGVLVVAQGAGSAETARSIAEAVQALFGIEANKIKVVKMRT